MAHPQSKTSPKFPNTEAGIADAVAWVHRQVMEGELVVVGMEATGSYHDRAARGFFAAGMAVYVHNPYRVSNYVRGQIRRTKTDAVDARKIAEYTVQHQEHRWMPPSEAIAELRELSLVRAQLLQQQQQLRSQLHAAGYRPTTSQAETYLQPVLKAVTEELARVDLRLVEVRRGQTLVGRRMQLVMGIPGVGPSTAAEVVARVDPTQFKRRNEVTAFAGLNPREISSGSSIRGRASIGPMGPHALRRTLYMAAVSAVRCNPDLRRFAERLRDRGKPTKVILVAVMRKLLLLCWSVLRTGQPYHSAMLKATHREAVASGQFG